jgi:Protein of unknown function (DUF3224)
MSSTPKTHAVGRIEVQSYEPRVYDQVEGGPDVAEIHVSESFHGDIEGEGVVRFLQVSRADGSASFVGMERVRGRIAQRSGTFLLQDAGTLKAGTVSGEWFVIPGSGTGQLHGLRGEGGFSAELGQGADITLDYWFE